MSKIFISCDEAHILCTRDQYSDLNSKEKFRFKLHNGHCVRCKNFSKKSRGFTRTLSKLGWVKLSLEQKSSIKEKLKTAMRK